MESKLHDHYIGPAVAVDTVILGTKDDLLVVLLLHIKGGPYDNKWALPGGLVRLGESPESAAIRVLKDKTNIRSGYLEQLYTFGNPDRDVRGQVVSVSHLLLVKDPSSYELIPSEHYDDIAWKPVNDLPEVAFDHKQIIGFALTRLKSKLGYSNIAQAFLPSEFTMDQLQKVYEIILEEKKDPASFSQQITKLNIVSAVKNSTLFAFRNQNLNYFD